MPDTRVQLYAVRRGLIRRYASLLLFSWLAACAAQFNPNDQITADVPTRADVAGVPLIQQAAFFCGPTSIAMVMQWSGHDTTQQDIAALAFTDGAGGTYTADMIGSARRSGQLAVEISTLDQLLAEVAAGHPVIVFQNLGISIARVWHYGVVTGYDLQKDEVYLNSGQRDKLVMPFAVFESSWRRGGYWGLLILPPDQFPVSVREKETLSAVSALERAGQFDAAQTAYVTGAVQWPDNWIWQFGLGNARYAAGDLVGAKQALQAARKLGPDIPEVRTNLAHVTAELAAG